MRRPSTGGWAERARSTSLPHEDHTSTRVEGVRDKIIWLGGQGENRNGFTFRTRAWRVAPCRRLRRIIKKITPNAYLQTSFYV